MGHPLDDADAALNKTLDLVRVVGHQPHFIKAHMLKHPGSRHINPLIGVVTQLLVGVQGVEAPVLKLVGAQFVDQPDAPAFLRQI